MSSRKVTVFRRRSSIEAKQEVFRGTPALIVNDGVVLFLLMERSLTFVVIVVVDVDGVLNCRCWLSLFA